MKWRRAICRTRPRNGVGAVEAALNEGAVFGGFRLRFSERERKLRVEIAMDGGLGRDNIRLAVEAGVELGIFGSAVFGAPDPAAALRELRRLADSEIA